MRSPTESERYLIKRALHYPFSASRLTRTETLKDFNRFYLNGQPELQPEGLDSDELDLLRVFAVRDATGWSERTLRPCALFLPSEVTHGTLSVEARAAPLIHMDPAALKFLRVRIPRESPPPARIRAALFLNGLFGDAAKIDVVRGVWTLNGTAWADPHEWTNPLVTGSADPLIAPFILKEIHV